MGRAGESGNEARGNRAFVGYYFAIIRCHFGILDREAPIIP